MTYGRPGVYVTETLIPAPVAASGSANAAGAAIGAFPQGPSTVTLVTSWYDFVQQFGGFNALYPATFGVNQFFVNGGAELYVKRVLSSDATVASVNIPKSTTGTLGTASSVNKGADSNNFRIQITGTSVANYYNLTVYKEIVSAYLGTTNSNATNDIIVEQFSNVRFDSTTSPDYAQSVVNSQSQYIVLSLASTGTPATQSISSVLPLTGGADGTAPVAADYTAAINTAGTSEFDTIERPLVLFAPSIYEKFVADGDASAATNLATVHDAMIAWANSGSGFAIIDTAPGLTVAQAITYVTARPDSSQAAAYYPNYFIQDPTARSSQALRKVSPAGAVAGLYLATDKSEGPFKSPAGTAADIRGAISLERAFSPSDLDSLNTGAYVSGGSTVYGTSVNAIRNLPGAGIVVMGARTLLQDGTANRYVSTRRSLIYINKQLQNITQFAVFRNNDGRLWEQLKTAIGVFLNEYRNQGGLRGVDAPSSYYVKVDSTNNTPATIATGVVNIEVGIALEYPAEFVVINLSQITGN